MKKYFKTAIAIGFFLALCISASFFVSCESDTDITPITTQTKTEQILSCYPQCTEADAVRIESFADAFYHPASLENDRIKGVIYIFSDTEPMRVIEVTGTTDLRLVEVLSNARGPNGRKVSNWQMRAGRLGNKLVSIESNDSIAPIYNFLK